MDGTKNDEPRGEPGRHRLLANRRISSAFAHRKFFRKHILVV
jgi:hypothetical protein